MIRLSILIEGFIAAVNVFAAIGWRQGLGIAAALVISGCSGSVVVRSDSMHGTAGHAGTNLPGTPARMNPPPASGSARIGTPGQTAGSPRVRIGTGGAQLSAHGPAGMVVLGALIVSGLVEYVLRKMEERLPPTDEEYIERPREDMPSGR